MNRRETVRSSRQESRSKRSKFQQDSAITDDDDTSGASPCDSTTTAEPTPSPHDFYSEDKNRIYPHNKMIPKLLYIDLAINDASTVERAFFQLADACETNLTNRLEIVNGHTVMMNAMIKWKENASIFQEACRALLNASFEQSEFCETVVELGLFGIVRDGMDDFVEEEEVQDMACSLLSNLTYNNRERTEQALAVNCHVALVRAMYVYTTNKDLQIAGCAFLTNAVQWNDIGLKILSDTDVICVLKETISWFSDTDDLDASICKAANNVIDLMHKVDISQRNPSLC
jgi:hypothetical protein